MIELFRPLDLLSYCVYPIYYFLSLNYKVTEGIVFKNGGMKLYTTYPRINEKQECLSVGGRECLWEGGSILIAHLILFRMD